MVMSQAALKLQGDATRFGKAADQQDAQNKLDDIARRRDRFHDVLHAVGGKLVGLSHAMPCGRGPRRTPAQIAHRRRGERDAFEDRDGGVLSGNALY